MCDKCIYIAGNGIDRNDIWMMSRVDCKYGFYVVNITRVCGEIEVEGVGELGKGGFVGGR